MDKFVEPLPPLTQGHYIVGDRGKELTLTEEDVQEQLKLDQEMMKLRNEQCKQCKKHFEEVNE